MYTTTGFYKILVNMRYILRIHVLLFVLIYALSGCADGTGGESAGRGVGEIVGGEKMELEYHNIMIYADLSNRLDKTPNDSAIIEQLISYFEKECVKPKTKINDRSSLYFSRLNHYESSCRSYKIDVESKDKLEEKQKFVNRELGAELDKFRNAVQCNYMERDSGGLDLVMLIYNEIKNGLHLKKDRVQLGEYDTISYKYYNHIFILTDGYLEFSNKDVSQDYQFSSSQIGRIRRRCIRENISPQEAIMTDSAFRIKPLPPNDNIGLVNLYIMETDDRSFDPRSGTYQYSLELSDNEILRQVWQRWAEESGFRSFTWRTKTSSTTLSQDYIKNIIETAINPFDEN
jgi:hypothetical protein